MKLLKRLMKQDEFIAEYADNDEQKEFFNTLSEEHKEHIRTFMLAYVGYGIHTLFMELKKIGFDNPNSIDEELRKLMDEN